MLDHRFNHRHFSFQCPSRDESSLFALLLAFTDSLIWPWHESSLLLDGAFAMVCPINFHEEKVFGPSLCLLKSTSYASGLSIIAWKWIIHICLLLAFTDSSSLPAHKSSMLLAGSLYLCLGLHSRGLQRKDVWTGNIYWNWDHRLFSFHLLPWKWILVICLLLAFTDSLSLPTHRAFLLLAGSLFLRLGLHFGV